MADKDKERKHKDKKEKRDKREHDKHKKKSSKATGEGSLPPVKLEPPQFIVPAGWTEAERGPPEINPVDIQILNEIGAGAYGTVYKGTCRGNTVAVKIPNVQKFVTEEDKAAFQREVATMAKIFNPNVVLFMGACTQDGNIRIVTELLTGDVDHYLKRQLVTEEAKRDSLFKRLRMARDAAKGMAWLHGVCKMIHRDLKPANLLIDSHGTVKVADFGFAEALKYKHKDVETLKGTALYMAPEVMQAKEFNHSIDVYAFGIILWQFYTCQEPFGHHSEWAPFARAVSFNNERPPLDHKCPESLKQLIESCWAADPLRRPPFNLLVNQLDEILIELALPEPVPRAFWKHYFLDQGGELVEAPSWRTFMQAVQKSSLVADANKFAPLASVVKAEQPVSIETFNHLCQFFGYFFSPDHKHHIDESYTLVTSPWYQADVSKEAAELSLKEQAPGGGEFLVRTSTTYPDHPFTLSIAPPPGTAECRHVRIKRVVKTPNSIKYSIILSDRRTVKEYDSLIALIDAEDVRKDFGLQRACPPRSAGPRY